MGPISECRECRGGANSSTTAPYGTRSIPGGVV